MGGPSAKRQIGILGGMEPEATVLLMAKVMEMTSASYDCNHVAMFVDYNTHVPSRIAAFIKFVGADLRNQNSGEDSRPENI